MNCREYCSLKQILLGNWIHQNEPQKEDTMITIEQLIEIIKTEALFPDTHECLSCGRTFSPNEDGCPFCGINAPVSLVPELPKKGK